MIKIVCLLALLCLIADAAKAQAPARSYILKPGDGEVLFGGMIILKATPKDGTAGGEMMVATLAPGASTGLHRHELADEFFYVVSGNGFVILDTVEVAIGPGDAIFIPRGHDHQLRNDISSDPVQLVAFLDKPGLADYFRAEHRKLQEKDEVAKP